MPLLVTQSSFVLCLLYVKKCPGLLHLSHDNLQMPFVLDTASHSRETTSPRSQCWKGASLSNAKPPPSPVHPRLLEGIQADGRVLPQFTQCPFTLSHSVPFKQL